jgi:acyl-[acyl-carrier-protein] desaturase
MPGVKLVPDYDGRVEIMRSAGIDRAVFLQKVYFPILKYLGITRHEMLHAGRKLRMTADGGGDEGMPPTPSGVHEESQHQRVL